jgi:four helix bundle protein
MEIKSNSLLHTRSIAWQKAMLLTNDVYALTRKFPSDERFGLTNQLRRAAVSIASNIAEGKGRCTIGELIHFLGMARGSALEVHTQLEIASMQGFVSGVEIDKPQKLAEEVVRIINSSIQTLRSKNESGKPS